MRAAPWYDDVFESFNRKSRQRTTLPGYYKILYLLKENDMTYRRVLDAIAERISKAELPNSDVATEATDGDAKSSQSESKLKPLIDEAYYFSHSKFIERC